MKTAVGLLAAAGAEFARTPAGQKLKQQVTDNLVRLLESGERSIQSWRRSTRRRLGLDDAKGGLRRGPSAGRRPTRSGPQRQARARGRGRPSTRTRATRDDERRHAVGGVALGASPPGRLDHAYSERASMLSVPPWQERLRNRTLPATKPPVNPGSKRGRAADR